jgi:hypothetical protein
MSDEALSIVTATLGPAPRPPEPSPTSGVSGVIEFTSGVIRTFRERGFLTVAHPTFDDVVPANFAMLTEGWRAGVARPFESNHVLTAFEAFAAP